MTLAEFLKSQGASDEDVKALTEGSFSGVAKRAFDAAFAQAQAERDRAAAAEAARAAAEQGAESLQKWYDEKAAPEYTAMQNEVLRARAEEARARAVVKTAQERGLIDVATLAGYEVDPAKASAAGVTPAAPAGFDPNKFMPRDEVMKFVEMAGDGIALIEDIGNEHRSLFPDRPFNARELRREAIAAKKPFEQYWAEKFGVQAARDKRAADDRAAMEARLRKEGADAERQKMVDEGFNPGLRTPQPSQNIFAPRKAPDGSTKQPWEVGENEARRARLSRAMENEAKAVTH